MRKIYYSLLVLLLMMVSTTVKAQYEVNIDAQPTNDYGSGSQLFDAADIATALGLADADALQALIATASKDVDPNVGAFYIKTTDGKSCQYTGNPNEFWMDDAGLPHAYSGASWYVGVSFVAATDTTTAGVSMYVGQMPSVFTKKYEPSTLKTTVYLVNGDKEVSFDVTQNIAAAPEPATLSDLTIVKDYNFGIEFEAGGEYEGQAFSTTLDGIYDALGISQEELDADVNAYLFTQLVKAEIQNEGEDNETTIYSMSDYLENPSAASGGAWFGRYINYDEASDKEVALDYNLPKDWGAGATFYLQKPALADGEFTIGSVGQYPGTMKAGDTDFTYLYIVVGDKAARIKVQATIAEKENPTPGDDVPFDQCTKAGEQTIEVVDVAKNDYETKNFTINMEDVLEKLGCEAADITTHYRWMAEGQAIDYSQTNDGYTGQDGFSGADAGYSWSNKAPVFVQPVTLAEGKFKVGQYAGIYTGKVADHDSITSNVVITTSILFKYSDKYYEAKLQYTIQPFGTEIETDDPGVNPDSEFDIVATLPITMQLIPSSNYYAQESEEVQAQMQLDLGIDKIKELIGEGTYTVYGLKAPASAKVYPELTPATGYGANEGFTGGFWMAVPNEKLGGEYVNTSFAGNWGNNSYGIEWKLNDGIFGFDQFPDARKVGDFYVSTFYWVNTGNNKAIKYELSVVYVEEIVPQAEIFENYTESVAIEEDKIEQSKVGDFFDVAINKEKIASALGIDVSLLSGVQAYYAKSMGVWATMTPGSDVQYFNANGYEDTETGVEAAFSEDYVVTLTLDDVELGDNDKITLRYAFEYDGKRMLYTVQLGTPTSEVVGISNVAAPKAADGAYYTLTGVKVAQPTEKGIYIKGGKKVFVK